MNAKEVVERMKDFGLKGVRDGSVHFFIKPDLLAEFVQNEILAEREACAKLCESLPVREDDVADECAAAIRARSNAAHPNAAIAN